MAARYPGPKGSETAVVLLDTCGVFSGIVDCKVKQLALLTRKPISLVS